jgi:hypothetical protein
MVRLLSVLQGGDEFIVTSDKGNLSTMKMSMILVPRNYARAEQRYNLEKTKCIFSGTVWERHCYIANTCRIFIPEAERIVLKVSPYTMCISYTRTLLVKGRSSKPKSQSPSTRSDIKTAKFQKSLFV